MVQTREENLSDVAPVTSGIKTTEFWKSLGSAVITLLVGVGVITPSNNAHTKEIIDSVALIASSVTVVGYAISRAITKASAVKAKAQVIAARKPSVPTSKSA